jgi:hypothetical protein
LILRFVGTVVHHEHRQYAGFAPKVIGRGLPAPHPDA